MILEVRAYEEVMKETVKLTSLTNYWKSPCTFVKIPEDFENHHPSGVDFA